jgi:recombinational DNA repair protein (RecF pathway)
MSYSVYSTRGFIVGSAPSGEAGKTYSIYTEQFGLLRAHAQGVRHLKSKLRYNLTDYSFGTFSLVRGKEFWRITGAVAETAGVIESQGISLVRARILSFMRRLVQGEERNDDLFLILLDLFSSASSTLSERDELLVFETRVLARALSALGYIDMASIEGMGQKDMLVAINKALRESHL